MEQKRLSRRVNRQNDIRYNHDPNKWEQKKNLNYPYLDSSVLKQLCDLKYIHKIEERICIYLKIIIMRYLMF